MEVSAKSAEGVEALFDSIGEFCRRYNCGVVQDSSDRLLM